MGDTSTMPEPISEVVATTAVHQTLPELMASPYYQCYFLKCTGRMIHTILPIPIRFLRDLNTEERLELRSLLEDTRKKLESAGLEDGDRLVQHTCARLTHAFHFPGLGKEPATSASSQTKDNEQRGLSHRDRKKVFNVSTREASNTLHIKWASLDELERAAGFSKSNEDMGEKKLAISPTPTRIDHAPMDVKVENRRTVRPVSKIPIPARGPLVSKVTVKSSFNASRPLDRSEKASRESLPRYTYLATSKSKNDLVENELGSPQEARATFNKLSVPETDISLIEAQSMCSDSSMSELTSEIQIRYPASAPGDSDEGPSIPPVSPPSENSSPGSSQFEDSWIYTGFQQASPTSETLGKHLNDLPDALMLHEHSTKTMQPLYESSAKSVAVNTPPIHESLEHTLISASFVHSFSETVAFLDDLSEGDVSSPNVPTRSETGELANESVDEDLSHDETPNQFTADADEPRSSGILESQTAGEKSDGSLEEVQKISSLNKLTRVQRKLNMKSSNQVKWDTESITDQVCKRCKLDHEEVIEEMPQLCDISPPKVDTNSELQLDDCFPNKSATINFPSLEMKLKSEMNKWLSSVPSCSFALIDSSGVPTSDDPQLVTLLLHLGKGPYVLNNDICPQVLESTVVVMPQYRNASEPAEVDDKVSDQKNNQVLDPKGAGALDLVEILQDNDLRLCHFSKAEPYQIDSDASGGENAGSLKLLKDAHEGADTVSPVQPAARHTSLTSDNIEPSDDDISTQGTDTANIPKMPADIRGIVDIKSTESAVNFNDTIVEEPSEYSSPLQTTTEVHEVDTGNPLILHCPANDGPYIDIVITESTESVDMNTSKVDTSSSAIIRKDNKKSTKLMNADAGHAERPHHTTGPERNEKEQKSDVLIESDATIPTNSAVTTGLASYDAESTGPAGSTGGSHSSSPSELNALFDSSSTANSNLHVSVPFNGVTDEAMGGIAFGLTLWLYVLDEPDDINGCLPPITEFCCQSAGGNFKGKLGDPFKQDTWHFASDYDCPANSISNRLSVFWGCCHTWLNEDKGKRTFSDCHCPVNLANAEMNVTRSFRDPPQGMLASELVPFCNNHPEIHE
ncbi:hypothetical protein N0V90_008961 [Kalmusia sp. IMI 367209]|nr:hypothetical protein N0V90_008961 [Kalmusia sp. IMI 367209]